MCPNCTSLSSRIHRSATGALSLARIAQREHVAHDLTALLGPLGVVHTAELAGRVDKHTITAWVRKRRLLRPYPAVLVHPDQWEEWPGRAMAAVLATDGALSHASALAVWRVVPKQGPIHVSIPAGRRALRAPGLAVHQGGHSPSTGWDPFRSPRSPGRSSTPGARDIGPVPRGATPNALGHPSSTQSVTVG